MPAHFEGTFSDTMRWCGPGAFPGGSPPKNASNQSGGSWKPAGSAEWRPLVWPTHALIEDAQGRPEGVTSFDIRTPPPEGPQPARWVAQPPITTNERRTEHYHALLRPLVMFLRAITGRA